MPEKQQGRPKGRPIIMRESETLSRKRCNMSISELDRMNKKPCPCGKEHSFDSDVIVGEGVINQLPEVLDKFSAKKVYLIADINTYAAAGEEVCKILEESGICVHKYVFNQKHLHPDETSVGLAIMNIDMSVDAVVGVGSGVINDISKIVANVSNKPYIIVGTAPSMDGYASATSSMTRDGFKISLDSKCADVIIGDVNILSKAPLKLFATGLGDMLAKYVSICEWRIANIVVGEYYCEEVADLVRKSLKKCVDNAEGLLKGDKQAVAAVFEGLVISGVAMNFAGCSRPASGIEHYFSHLWDMRSVEFGTPAELHGIQCALGTLIAIRLYEKIKEIKPDREKALKSAEKFSFDLWSEELRKFLGKGAENMIALEAEQKKYDSEKHKKRLDLIIENWDEILKIIDEELPSSKYIAELMDKFSIPKTMEDIGVGSDIYETTFLATKDIRDKYILSRLCWDLGIDIL